MLRPRSGNRNWQNSQQQVKYDSVFVFISGFDRFYCYLNACVSYLRLAVALQLPEGGWLTASAAQQPGLAPLQCHL